MELSCNDLSWDDRKTYDYWLMCYPSETSEQINLLLTN